MSDKPIERMTVKELRELKDRIDIAIRAKIAQQRSERQSTPLPQGGPTLIDLERERDAWTARKKA